jgi:uncharacterized protein
VRFWDASAVVPLLTDEPTTATLSRLLRADRHVVVWWATDVECESSLRRRARAGGFDATQLRAAESGLASWRETWEEIAPTAGVRDVALRLLAVHPLRAADALQLAAALKAARGRPSSLSFVCLDRRLADAAAREGLDVIPVT